MTNWKNKIKRKSLGEAPAEASENIQAPEFAPAPQVRKIAEKENFSSREELEQELAQLRDKRLTGRIKQLGLKVKAEFHRKLKKLALEENCYLVEILERAVECYEREKEK